MRGRYAESASCPSLNATMCHDSSRHAKLMRMTLTDPSVTYGSYLAVDELLALQRPRSRRPRTRRDALHRHSPGLRAVVQAGAARSRSRDRAARGARSVSRAAFAEAHPHDPQGARRAARHPRDHDAARVPVVSRSGSKRRADFNPISSGSSSSCSATSRARRSSGFLPAAARARALEQRFGAPTLWDAFLTYLSREGYAIPPASLSRDVTARIEPSPELQATLIDLYRTRSEARRDVRAARRSRRRPAGVALSPRQDGAAHDRREDRHRRIERRAIPRDDA